MMELPEFWAVAVDERKSPAAVTYQQYTAPCPLWANGAPPHLHVSHQTMFHGLIYSCNTHIWYDNAPLTPPPANLLAKMALE